MTHPGQNWLVATLVLALAAALFSGCAREAPAIEVAHGDPARGRKAMAQLQCGVCHVIPGVSGARGRVGPSLERFRHRSFLAGKWRNEPEAVIRWLMDPPAMSPLTAMPAVGASDSQARDMAAYLYTLQ
jgi:cytochrome c2